MLIDRQDRRKDLEAAYRQQLKSEVQEKRSRIKIVPIRDDYHPENESFTLIDNIQKQQLQRKKKSQEYYDQLRQQIEQEKRLKQQKDKNRKKKQLEQDNKIKQELQKLQQRYQEEIKREKKGKKQDQPSTLPQKDPPKTPPSLSPINIRKNTPVVQQQTLRPIQQNRRRLTSQPLSESSHQTFKQLEPPPVSLYNNRIENETFNYVPRHTYKETYFKELLGQRKRFEEQTSHIVELNRFFNVQKFRKKQQSRGLQELRNLYKALDGAGAELAQGFTKSQASRLRPLKKVNKLKSFSTKERQDQWRKLD